MKTDGDMQTGKLHTKPTCAGQVPAASSTAPHSGNDAVSRQDAINALKKALDNLPLPTPLAGNLIAVLNIEIALDYLRGSPQKPDEKP